MVAKMANYGEACHLQERCGDGPTPEEKENACTSTEESSEEEEDEEEDEDSESAAEKADEDRENEETEADLSHNEPIPGPDGVVTNGHDVILLKICCDKCKATPQSHGSELVTPRKISKGRLQVQLEGEGTYECTVTGLVFEVSERVLIRYSVLSWSKFGALLQASWRFAGPIFNVETVGKDHAVLKSIQFPHSLCLADPENEMTFSVLHIKDNRPVIEPTADHSGSHVKWCVSSLSPVGPIVQASQPVEHHGVVLVYKELGSSSGGNSMAYIFRIYLATNNSSDIKDIGKQVRNSNKYCMKVEKPPTCKLKERKYYLTSEPEGEITPKVLPFTLEVIGKKGYFEAFFEQPPPFKLSLKDTETDKTVWSSTIREGDCVDHRVAKKRIRTETTTTGRKRSSSVSEEETGSKKFRGQDESDGIRPVQSMSEKQLMKVAKQLGNEWKQVAIYIDLNTKDLEEIQAEEKDVLMQKHKMLLLWQKRRKPGEATAQQLLESLEDLAEVSNEARQTLKDMMDNGSAE